MRQLSEIKNDIKRIYISKDNKIILLEFNYKPNGINAIIKYDSKWYELTGGHNRISGDEQSGNYENIFTEMKFEYYSNIIDNKQILMLKNDKGDNFFLIEDNYYDIDYTETFEDINIQERSEFKHSYKLSDNLYFIFDKSKYKYDTAAYIIDNGKIHNIENIDVKRYRDGGTMEYDFEYNNQKHHIYHPTKLFTKEPRPIIYNGKEIQFIDFKNILFDMFK